MYVGYFYENADSTYINNIVEFTKNQPSYNYKIENFFNSSSNAFVIKYYQLLRQSLNYLNADTPQKKDVLTARQDYKESISFITTLGNDFIKAAYYDIKEKDLKAHNIIKTILLFSYLIRIYGFSKLYFCLTVESEFNTYNLPYIIESFLNIIPRVI